MRSGTFQKILFPLFLTLVLGSFPAGLYSQGKLKRAIREMEKLNFTEAINLLKDEVAHGTSDEAMLHLAECYRRTSDWENARLCYSRIVETPLAEPVHKLYYGQALMREGRSREAAQWFETYLEAHPNDMRASNLLLSCELAPEMHAPVRQLYQVEHLPINTPYSEHSPAFFQGGLLFASDRKEDSPVSRTNAFTGYSFLDFYYATGATAEVSTCGLSTFGKVEKADDGLNSTYHDATISFALNGELAFFTRTSFAHRSKEGLAKLKIFMARKTGPGQWSESELLPFNENDYSYAHPSITPDGKRLFFSSDREGGYGGMDIYVSEFINGSWTSPMNVGPTINTEGNELFPHYAFENRTLYFSSDGHLSLGGLDILSVEEKERRNWGPVTNLGVPINSFADDFGMAVSADGMYGYFSSDRIGGLGQDDLYSFCKISSRFEFYVYDIETLEPIEGIEVTGSCPTNFGVTDADGKARDELMQGECCTIQFQKDGYLPNQRQVCAEKRGGTTYIEVPMEARPFIIIEGIVFDEEDFPKEGATVTLFTECPESPPVSMLTNATGRFYFKVEPECCYTAIAAAPGYRSISTEKFCRDEETTDLVFRSSLQLHSGTEISSLAAQEPYGGESGMLAYEELTPRSPVIIPGLFPISRSVSLDATGIPKPYLLPLFYQYNSAELVESSLPALQQLHFFLLENPGIIIEIGAHTDARGSDHYNLMLSRQRAENLRSWLVKRGIDGARLIAKGYGESRIINHCTNGTNCSEVEHDINRRTEFRILNQFE